MSRSGANVLGSRTRGGEIFKVLFKLVEFYSCRDRHVFDLLVMLNYLLSGLKKLMDR